MIPLTNSDLAMFSKIRVGPELLEQAKIVRVDDQEARELLAMNGTYGNMGGILFPYISPKTGFRVSARVRRDCPEFEDGKPKRKYIGGYGDRRLLYVLPGTPEDLLNDPNTPIGFVEAEKSVLALTAWAKRVGKQIVFQGLGGCWNWRGRIGKIETVNGDRVDEVGPLPDLKLCGGGRKAYVIFDYCKNNDEVRRARAAFVRQLHKQKAKIQIVDLPAFGGNGPDDFVGTKGDEALCELFDQAISSAQEDSDLSEDGLALHFADLHEVDLRYIFLWSKWLRYEGAWKPDIKQKTYSFARDIARECSTRCTEKQSVKSLRSASTVAAVVRLAQSDPRIAAIPDDFDSNPWLFNTPGGTVDLKTGELREHRREDYLTKTSGITPKVADCPLWNSFLDRITNEDHELQRYLQRFAGYSLTGLTSEHVLAFLYGTGANGKTTYTNTLLNISGEYGQVAQMETFTESKNDRHPTELAALRGARLVVASETEVGKRWAESRIKSLTGGEPIRARFMHCDEFEFVPQFKLMIQGNHKPGLRAVDEAIRRRVHLVPFLVTIPPEERDPKLGEKLRGEYPAILQWAINGCIAWQQVGLNPPPAVRNATEEYFTTEDAIRSWLDECAIVSPQAGTTKTSVLYQNFKAWAERTGEYCGSQKRFSQDLQNRGLVIRRSMGKVVDGVALRNENDE
jgi:putative DNA primase/helicase